MRVAIFSDNFYPEISGISDSIISLARALARHGHTVNFFVPKYSLKNYRRVGSVSTAEPDLGPNIKITRFFSFPFPSSGTGQARLVIPGPWCLGEIKKFNPDIIHTQHFFGVGIIALWAAKILKVPLVGTNHTVISEFINYSPIKFKNLGRWAERYVNWYYNHCAFVTTPGADLLAEMEKVGLRAPHAVVGNPLALEHFSNLASDKKSELKKNFCFSAHTLVYAGRLAVEKKIEVLLRALPLVLRRYPDAMLVLAGQGSHADGLKKLAENLNIVQSVKFLGMLDQVTLNKIYNAGEIFVTASTSEVQSMTMLQAMACGLAVVGVRARGVAELIGDDGLLFAPESFEELARQILFLFDNPAERARLGVCGINKVSAFTPETIALQWENIYNKVVKNN